MIPAREDIGVRRLPPAMAVGDVDCHMRVGQRHAPEVGDHGAGQVVQRALIDIRSGAVHGPQHPVGHDRGAGNGKVGPTVGQGHGAISGLLRQRRSAGAREGQLTPGTGFTIGRAPAMVRRQQDDHGLTR